jgi:Mg2+ and Co2+ transporter CorA
MTGTPRSYALDPDVVRFLDSLPDGRKRPNQWTKRHYAASRSKTVSQAVRAYYLTDQFDEIKQLYKNIEGLQGVIRDLHDELRDLKGSRGLLHRLKRLLRKRE